MAITLSQLIQRARDRLKDSLAIDSWCKSEFGADAKLKVFVGIDHRDPPGQKDCPLVIIHPPNKDGGQEVAQTDFRLQIDWGIKNSAVNKVENLVEYSGVYQADALGELIWEELKGMSDNIALSKSNYSLETIEFFPLFIGQIDVDITVPTVIGGNIEL